ASLRLRGRAAGDGPAPGGARVALRPRQELPAGRQAVQPSSQVVRGVGQAPAAPPGPRRELRAAGNAAGRDRAAPARAKERGWRLLPAVRSGGPAEGSAQPAGGGEEVALARGRVLARPLEVRLVEKVERLFALREQLLVAVAATARSLEQGLHAG